MVTLELPNFRAVVGEQARDRCMDETIRAILLPAGRSNPWDRARRPAQPARVQGNSKYVALRSVSTDPAIGGRATLPVLQPDMSGRGTGTPRTPPHVTLMANKMQQIQGGLAPMGSGEELQHFHRFNKSLNSMQLRRDLFKGPTVQMEYILNKKPAGAEAVNPLLGVAVDALREKPRSKWAAASSASSSSTEGSASNSAGSVLQRIPSFQRAISGAGGFQRTPSGSGGSALFRRVSSQFRRIPSSGLSRRRSVALQQTPSMQGREYVQALERQERAAPAKSKDILDRPKQKDANRIQAFCDTITGSADQKFVKKCQHLLTLMPDDRSFSDLSTLLDLVARLPFLSACTSAEKFAIVRTGRLQPFKAGQTVSNGGDTTRLLVVLQSGALREQNFNDNTVRDLAIFEPLGDLCWFECIRKAYLPVAAMCSQTLTLDFQPLDPGGVLPLLCNQLKNLGTMGQEKKGWSSPRNSSLRLGSIPVLPKIESRPSTTVQNSAMLLGGRFVAKTDATCFEVDVHEFNTCLDFYTRAANERQGNSAYVASFLAALEIFSSWPWLEVVELSHQVKSVQVDKGVCLLSQGDRVDGIHVLHRGEAQVEFKNVAAHRPAAGSSEGADEGPQRGRGASGLGGVNRGSGYGVSVHVTADAQGLPTISLSKNRHSKSIGLTVSSQLSLCQSVDTNGSAVHSICGPRSAFGEEIALNGQHQPPGGSKGAADPKKLDEFAPRHTYSVRMNAASELFLIPRQVLLDFFSGGARRRQDMKKELFDKLSALAAGRESWITPMAQKLNQTRHEINRVISPTKGLY